MRSFVHFATALTLACAATLVQAGCFRCDPVFDVVDAPVPTSSAKALTTDQVRAAIIRAGADLGWHVSDAGSGRLVATIALRKHTAEIEIPYSDTAFSITYKNSTNLDAADGQIHKNYNGWIQNLSRGIQRQLATS
ncbi:MAG: hypothetical protein JWQ11_3739 [Rhizobacter sp.]|nr:hypothetical protein [Rhizobacter sp.]